MIPSVLFAACFQLIPFRSSHNFRSIILFEYMIFLKIIHEEECFVNESVEKPAIYDLLFLIAIYYPKNDRKYPSEMRI